MPIFKNLKSANLQIFFIESDKSQFSAFLKT